MVKLHGEGLTDAQLLLMAACQHDAAVAHGHAEALVVGIDGRHKVPLAVAVVFSRGGGHEAAGMSPDNCQLAVHHEHSVACTGNIQVGQALRLQLHLRASRHRRYNNGQEKTQQRDSHSLYLQPNNSFFSVLYSLGFNDSVCKDTNK